MKKKSFFYKAAVTVEKKQGIKYFEFVVKKCDTDVIDDVHRARGHRGRTIVFKETSEKIGKHFKIPNTVVFTVV